MALGRLYWDAKILPPGVGTFSTLAETSANPNVWVLYVSYATSDDKIVGTATLTKKRAIYNSQELVVGEVGDTYTLSDIIRNGKPTSLSNLNSNPNSYVNRSVFGRLISETTHRASIDGVSIISGTPNKNSFAGYTKRLKFLNYKQYKNTINYRPSTQLLNRISHPS